jgi:cellulose synthase/poly-beta-1,6-N-acetylglucosamine synthase-like glycosyltransferase
LESILHIFDDILFVVFAINIAYLLVYSMAAALHPTQSKPARATKHRRIAILIPAYKEDAVIHECVRSCLKQNYPPDKFDTVVISDRMTAETNASLAALHIILVTVRFEKSTKSKSLNHAMAVIGNNYDIAVILDADNVISDTFLSDINDMFDSHPDIEIVQAHRVAKNRNNSIAFLDGISEEINNSIFRLGHAQLGMSAALIGSGMAFNYRLFRETMAGIRAVGGFDRELELTLLLQNKRFYYLQDTRVWDEKIQSHDDFSRQRRRWLSAQWHYSVLFARYLPTAFRAGQWDFCDKLYQQFSMPRLLLIGFTFLIALGWSFLRTSWSLKWWALFVCLAIALLIAIPRYYYNRRLWRALCSLPYTFFIMAGNIFKLRGANKTFIHTKHGK